MMTEGGLRIDSSVVERVIYTRTSYTPRGSSEHCASGDACAAPPWFQLSGKRPPSWTIIGEVGVYCADCIRDWAIAIARLEGVDANTK